jgi:hypothetical protein
MLDEGLFSKEMSKPGGGFIAAASLKAKTRPALG